MNEKIGLEIIEITEGERKLLSNRFFNKDLMPCHNDRIIIENSLYEIIKREFVFNKIEFIFELKRIVVLYLGELDK